MNLRLSLLSQYRICRVDRYRSIVNCENMFNKQDIFYVYTALIQANISCNSSNSWFHCSINVVILAHSYAIIVNKLFIKHSGRRSSWSCRTTHQNITVQIVLTTEYQQKIVPSKWMLGLWLSLFTWHNTLMFYSSNVWSKCNSWFVSSCKTSLQNTSSIVDYYWLIHRANFLEGNRLLWQYVGRIAGKSKEPPDIVSKSFSECKERLRSFKLPRLSS